MVTLPPLVPLVLPDVPVVVDPALPEPAPEAAPLLPAAPLPLVAAPPAGAIEPVFVRGVKPIPVPEPVIGRGPLVVDEVPREEVVVVKPDEAPLPPAAPPPEPAPAPLPEPPPAHRSQTSLP